MVKHLSLALALLGAACDAPVSTTDGGADGGALPEAVVRFDLSGEPRTQATFFDLPFPSDLRLTERGTPDLTGYPNPRVAAIDSLLPVAEDRPGWPVVPVAYFRFEAPVRALSAADLIAAETSSPILLLDVDPSSPGPRAPRADGGHHLPARPLHGREPRRRRRLPRRRAAPGAHLRLRDPARAR
ncbi:MAG: hypothetical protein M5U28_12260 [Sandaracinaceae bacterium]|nr:hypothetical protein [Sandaracinaceae bacterium]